MSIRVTPLLLMCAVLTLGAVAQKRELTYQLAEGTTIKYKRLENTTGMAHTMKGLLTEMNKSVESFLTIRVEKSSPEQLVLTVVQDTALVTDRAVSQSPGVDFDNVLTRRPVRLTLSRKGALLRAEPLAPLEVQGSPIPVNPGTFARRAMVFPSLPARTLSVGDTWTDSVSDTARPRYKDPTLGEGTGLRYTQAQTNYHVDSLVKLHGRECIKLTWSGTVSAEGKALFSSSERFTEDETTVDGTLYVRVSDGLPVRFTLRTRKQSTVAVFEQESEVLPSSSTTETTLIYLPS
ncbi:MAG: hypothetical protein HY962_08810 [Ignavibacteriae bacterium]|nr:hypothetical protein [Ignavibacteriota bacterium]